MSNVMADLSQFAQSTAGQPLSTLMSYPDRGNYGDNKWRGNFSGHMVADLLRHYQPKLVFDPMVGSGTTKDVCDEMGIPCVVRDLNPQWGGWDALSDEIPQSYDFMVWHPPYHDIIHYSGEMWGKADPRDLSRCASWEEFIEKMNIVQRKLFWGLRKGGRAAILVGDIKRKGVLYSMQKDMEWLGTPEQVLIKVQHNALSNKKSYGGKFIPIVHEYLLIFRRDDCYVVPLRKVVTVDIDLRQQEDVTWRDLVQATLEKLGGKATLEQLYGAIEGHKKTASNQNWHEKIRQTLQINPDFDNVERGVWRLQPLTKQAA